MNMFWVYTLLVVAPNLVALFSISLIFLGVGAGTAFVCSLPDGPVANEVSRNRYAKYAKRLFIALSTASFALTVLPSEKQTYLLAAAYTANEVPGTLKLPANLVGAANAYLEKVIKENLEPEKEK